MTRDPQDPDGSTRMGQDSPTGTSTGADVTARMTGTAPTARRGKHAAPSRADDARSAYPADRAAAGQAKTSAAAAFALVFGVSALLCALTGLLAPAAVVLGLVGVVLGVAGRRMAQRPGVTGRSVATGGLVTALLGLLLGAAVLAGVAVYVNDQGLDRLQEQIDDARTSLPSGQDVVDAVPGS